MRASTAEAPFRPGKVRLPGRPFVGATVQYVLREEDVPSARHNAGQLRAAYVCGLPERESPDIVNLWVMLDGPGDNRSRGLDGEALLYCPAVSRSTEQILGTWNWPNDR